jgi:raffinose/stachyose/melibiose transport system substrate-binding protein
MSSRFAPRLMSGVAVVAAAVSVGACGGGTQQDSGGGGSSGNGKVTLTLKHITGTDQKAMDAAIARFKKIEPNVTIKASYAPTDQLQTALRAQLGGGNAPDMFVVWPGNGSAMAVQQLAPTGVLADLSGAPWIKTVPDQLRPLLGDKGKTYMWSPGMTPIGAIYNKKVFRQAGIKSLPESWPQLLADADKIKAAGKIPFAVGNQTPWVTQLIPYAIAPSTAFTQDPNLAQEMLDGKKTFSNSGWRTVYQRYLELEKKGYFNPSPNGTTFEQQQAMVAQGKAAMAVQVAPVAGQIRDAAASSDNIGIFAFPANDQGTDLKIPAGLGAGLGVSSASKHQAEAKKFVDFLAQPDNTAVYANENLQLPLISGGKAPVNALVKPFAPFLARGNTVPFMDQQWPNAKVQPAHFAGVQELAGGKTDINGLLKKLDEAYKQQ